MRRRAVGAASAVLVALAGALAAGAPAVGAQADPPPGVGLAPEVAAVPASSPSLDRAEAALEDATRRLARDTAELEATSDELGTTTLEEAATGGLLARRGEQLAKAAAGADRLRADLRVLATEWFVTGFGAEEQLDPALGARAIGDLDQRRVLAESAAADTLADHRFVTRRVRALTDEVAGLAARREDLARRITALAGRRDRLTAAVAEDSAAVVRTTGEVAVERLNATVDGTDLSTIALDAYWRAAAALRVTDPSCGVRWWQIAGIGRTESRHGTYGGSRVGVDGRVTVPILGPPLDGSNGFAVVGDSDGGLLDGTATTDRAVGPMQFLPSTWRSLGRDATGDGNADPQNLYDAALAAGGYLCRSGPLSDEPALRGAYFTYNRSLAYVDVVVGHATGYRDGVPLD